MKNTFQTTYLEEIKKIEKVMDVEKLFTVTKELFAGQLTERTVQTVGEGRRKAEEEGIEFNMAETYLGRKLEDDDVPFFGFKEFYENDVDLKMVAVVLTEDEFDQYEVSPFQASMAMMGLVDPQIPRIVLKKELTGKLLEAKKGLIEMGEEFESPGE